jgi:shikimate kinase
MSTTVERIVLVGMMGSGKSAVGHALADLSGWRFADNDELLEAATGRSAREISADGEPALRAAEGAALRAGLELPTPSIVAAAAGTVLDPELRRELAGAGLVVWLQAPPGTLADRAVGAAHRPWLDGEPDWIETTAAERANLYAEVADLAVDTSNASPGEIAAEVMAALEPRRS